MSLRLLRPGESGPRTPEDVQALANAISRAVHATCAQAALEHDNRLRSFIDRHNRGMSPWGAQTSRYAPEPEEVESL